ncbi:MAG: hypothetical protein R3E54_06410 [Halioglobus sp.]
MASTSSFELHEEVCSNLDNIREIPTVSGSEDVVREKVIEAHKILMGISDENRARFKDLMAALEPG